MEPTKKRHPFVTFWLWLGIIVNVISIITSVVSFQNLTNLGYLGMQLINAGVDIAPFSQAIHTHVLILQVIAVVSGIILITAYALLLNWKKSGFWTLVITAFVVAVLNIIMMNLVKNDYAIIGLYINWSPAMQIFATPISIIILRAILQIRKDGKSCWSQLEPNSSNDDGVVFAPPVYNGSSASSESKPLSQSQQTNHPTEIQNYCSNCGTKLPEGTKFCHSCGAAVQEPITMKIDRPDDWKAYFRAILNNNFANYIIKEDVPVTDLVGDTYDVFKLYERRPNQVYKAEWGRPYDFVLYLGEEAKAVVMLGTGHTHNDNVKYLISKMFAKKLKVPYVGFYTQFPNKEDYVVARLQAALIYHF